MKDLITVLNGCKAKRAADQKKLYEHYYAFGKRVCMRYGASKPEVEEMLNDGFLKVFSNLEKFDLSLSFDAWLRTIMVRTCIDYYRKNGNKTPMYDIDSYVQIEDQGEDIFEKMSAEDILSMVQQLPPSYRTVFSLYVVDGFSHAEIAEMLKINEGTSRSNLAKARIKLKEWVTEYLNENQRDHEFF